MTIATTPDSVLPKPNGSKDIPMPTTSSGYSARVVRDIITPFILGWSLIELRSRVLIAALDDTKLPSTSKDSNLQSLLQTADPLKLVVATNERLLRASQMRAIFNTIVTLQRNKFDVCTTVGTLYNPPDENQVPYLHPDDPDYADIGINPLDRLDTNLDWSQWSDFRLFDVTRRAINCLTLLLVKPADSLIPDKIAADQKRLIAAILTPAESTTQTDNNGMATTDTSEQIDHVNNLDATKDTFQNSNTGGSDTNASDLSVDHGEAITKLSLLTVSLLQAWDGYLRERFTAEGVRADSLLTLMAFEAGRNMASISWNTSLNTIPLENQMKNEAKDQPKVAGNVYDQLYLAWKTSFTDSSLVQVLHQITALSAILDESYVKPNAKSTDTDTEDAYSNLLVKPDPTRPSQIVQAVKQSIEYWQRTILWLGITDNTTGGTASAPYQDKLMSLDDWRNLRNALIEQSGIWFNLMTGQQNLRGFTVGTVTHQIVNKAINNFTTLAQRDLNAAAQQAAQQARDVLSAGKRELENVFGSVKLILWVVVGVSIFLLAILLYLVATGQTQAVTGVITSLFTAALSLFGINASNKRQEKSAQNLQSVMDNNVPATSPGNQQKGQSGQSLAVMPNGIRGFFSNSFDQVSQFIIEAYQRGLNRIQIELQWLNYSLAVSHPLVEYFVRQLQFVDVREDYDFLTNVIWDKESREAELHHVVTAAFGPLTLLLKAPMKEQNGGVTIPPSTE
jgi:hypothetical protein